MTGRRAHRCSRALAASIALLPALALTACLGSPSPGPSPSGSTRVDGSRAFGDSFLYGTRPGVPADADHALRVVVADLGTYIPGRGARTEGHHAAYRRYSVVVTNTTDATWPLGRFRVEGLDGDEPGDTVIDAAKGIGTLPPATLPPGRTASWTIACSDDEGFPAVRVVPRSAQGSFPAALFKP